MRLAQVSDFHYTHLSWNPLHLFSKRFLGHLNWLCFRKNHFFEEQVEELPALFEELKIDLVLLGGDLSSTASKQEFLKAQELVQKIQQPWYAIPGNHDCYIYKSCKEKLFYRYFAHERKKIERPIEFFNLKKHRIEVHPLKKGWSLIALDTAIATNLYSSQGLFSLQLENSLKEVLSLIPETDQIILFNHYPFLENDAKRRGLIRAEALRKILEDTPRIRLYLHGHTHRQIVANLQASNLPIVLDAGSCAQGKKGAWNLIDLHDTGCEVTTYRFDHKWQNIRTEEFTWTR